MLRYNEYLAKDLSFVGFNIKKLEIFGNFIIEKKEVIKKIKAVISEFLNKYKDVDYLVVYYYPTTKDMENKIALCYFLLKIDIKNIDLLDIEILRNIQWNEKYDFFGSNINYKALSDYQLLKEANAMLKIIEDAYFVIYDLWVTENYKEFSGTDVCYKDISEWIMKASSVYKDCCELRSFADDDFLDFVCHMSNVLRILLQDVKINNEKENVFCKELENLRDNYELIHRKLADIIRIYSINDNDSQKDNFFGLINKV